MEETKEQIIVLINEKKYSDALKIVLNLKNISISDIESIIELFDDERAKTNIIKELLPEEIREKYIERFSSIDRKIEIIESLSDKNIKKYEQLCIEYLKTHRKHYGIVRAISEKELLEIAKGFNDDIELLSLITEIPQNNREKFMQFFSDDVYKKRVVVHFLPKTTIEKNVEYIQMLEQYIDEEMQDGKITDEILNIILKLPNEYIESKYMNWVEEYLKRNEKIPSNETSINVLKFIIQSKGIEYLKKDVIEKINPELQNECFAWDNIEQLIYTYEDEEERKVFLNSLSVEFQEKYIETLNDDSKKIERILALKDQKIIEKYIEQFEGENKLELIVNLSSDWQLENFEIIDELLNKLDKDKIFYVCEVSDIVKYKFIIKHKEDFAMNDLLALIRRIEEKDILQKILFKDKLLSSEALAELRKSIDCNFIAENIGNFIQLETQISEEDLKYILKNLKKVEDKIGDEIYKQIDFKILDSKYIEYLGIDSIIEIAKNDNLKSYLLNLEEGKLKVLSKCIENNPIKNEKDDYKRLLESMVSNISKGDFDDLINDIDDIEKLTEADISILTKILQKDNEFEIKSIKDLRNYEELKKQKCDEWIKSDDINVKRKAVLEKIFGLNRSYPEYYDIDDLQEGDVKKYLQSVQKIMEIDNPKILEDIYYELTEQIQIDELLMRKDIRKEYGKLYNDGLLKIEQCEKIGDNIYDAGTDFAMIIHSRIHTRDNKRYENYYKDWNREKSFKGFADYFCASYIRNDMIFGYGVEGTVTYGFSSLKPESFCGCSQCDNGSGLSAMDRGSSPKYLINNTGISDRGAFIKTPYNEVDYKIFSDDKRQQPDYIVVLRINGEIDEKSWSESIKAQKDWDEKLPIVIVDVNKCIEAERQRVEELKKEYEKSKSPILARQIYYKIRNNQHTIKSYGSRLQESFFEGELEQYAVTDEEIEKYTKEQNNETKQEVQSDNIPKTKMEKIFNRISGIISKSREIKPENVVITNEESKKSELEGQQENHENNIEQEKKIEIKPKDIAILDKENKITTTDVKRNILKRLLDKAKEKFKQGKNKDGR